MTTIVENRYVGVGFGERPGHAVLALYLTADDGPLDVEPGVSRHLRADVAVDAFDRREPGDAGRLRRRLLQDGLAARWLGGRESVQRVRMSRTRDDQPLAALRFGGGRPGRALARVVEAANDEPVFLCRASRRATMRRYGRRGGPAGGRPGGRGPHRPGPAATGGAAGGPGAARRVSLTRTGRRSPATTVRTMGDLPRTTSERYSRSGSANTNRLLAAPGRISGVMTVNPEAVPALPVLTATYWRPPTA